MSISLDTVNRQFGAASLKLIATGTTVTAQLGSSGYPITVHPYWKWIGSVYIKSSVSAITGTLEVITPTASYSVDISGDAGTAFARLYGSFSLTADASTTATMKLTLTGTTVGQQINIEGWQLEPVQGSTSLPSPFLLTLPMRTNDAIPDGSTYARILSSELDTGQHKIGVAGSGYKIGDPRQLSSCQVTGYGTVTSTTSILTGDSAGNVNIAAHSLYLSGIQISYAAQSSAISGLAAGTYYIYTRDNYAGGSPSYFAISNTTANLATINSYSDAYIVGYITIPPSGTSSGTTNPKLSS